MKNLFILIMIFACSLVHAGRPEQLKALGLWSVESEFGRILPAASKNTDYPSLAQKYLGPGTYEGYTSSRSKKCTVDVKVSSNYYEATIYGGVQFKKLAKTVFSTELIPEAIEKNGVLGIKVLEDQNYQTVYVGTIKSNLELTILNWSRHGGSLQHCQKLILK